MGCQGQAKQARICLYVIVKLEITRVKESAFVQVSHEYGLREGKKALVNICLPFNSASTPSTIHNPEGIVAAEGWRSVSLPCNPSITLIARARPGNTDKECCKSRIYLTENQLLRSCR